MRKSAVHLETNTLIHSWISMLTVCQITANRTYSTVSLHLRVYSREPGAYEDKSDTPPR